MSICIFDPQWATVKLTLLRSIGIDNKEPAKLKVRCIVKLFVRRKMEEDSLYSCNLVAAGFLFRLQRMLSGCLSIEYP